MLNKLGYWIDEFFKESLQNEKRNFRNSNSIFFGDFVSTHERRIDEWLEKNPKETRIF